MQRSSQVVSALLGVCLPVGATAAWAQDAATPDMTQRMQELEKQVAELKAALASMKTPPPAEAPAAPAPAAAAAAPAPASPISITSLLGPTTLSGFVDGYYGANFNHPASHTNQFRNFDIESNQFGLNMIELIVDKAPDAAASRLGYHVALGFGQALNTVNSLDGKNISGGQQFAQYLKEGYASYLFRVGKGLQVDAGKFVTPAGAEVIESKDNWNYSRGLLFAWAIPYYHYGLRAKYTFNDKFALTGYVMNGWNAVIDNNSGKTIGVSAAWTPTKKFGFIENYIGGPEGANNNADWRHLSDTVITFNPTGKLSLMANIDYGRGDKVTPITGPPSVTAYWTGAAGYLKYALASTVNAAFRYEYFEDHDGFATGTAQHFHEVTETLERTIASHLITRAEFRHDMSTQPVFQKGQGFDKSQNTLTGALILTFDTTGK